MSLPRVRTCAKCQRVAFLLPSFAWFAVDFVEIVVVSGKPESGYSSRQLFDFLAFYYMQRFSVLGGSYMYVLFWNFRPAMSIMGVRIEAMDGQVEVLAAVLQRTLSPDQETRKNAEKELWAGGEVKLGYGTLALQLIGSQVIPPEIRLAGVVALKNFVKRNWQEADDDVKITDEERHLMRDETLRLMFALSGNLRKQLSSTVCEMGRVDFPSRWQSLVQVLAQNLATQNLDQIIASLELLDDLTKKYRTESKSQELWVELKFVLDNLTGPLLELFKAMMVSYDQKDVMPVVQCLNWLEILHLIASNFCSLSSQDLPEPFEDNIATWMTGFQQLLSMKVPSIEQGADDKIASPLENLKVSICEIITLYTQRYEEETANYVSPFIQSAWEQLVEIDHRYRFDGLVNACLGLLSAICQRVQYKALFEGEGVINTLCESVIVKNLVLREDDMENFEDGSIEYLNRDLEGSDFETRRRGASDFVRALCKNFEAQVFPVLANIIMKFLNEYQGSPTQCWRQKDVFYCLVTAMASKGSTQRHGVVSTSNLVNVVEFYSNYVREDIIDATSQVHPVLRADAIKYVVTFRNVLPFEAVKETIERTACENQGAIGLLRKDHPLLHQYAAYAIERLLCDRLKATSDSVFTSKNTPVGPLIELLVRASQASNVLNTHYIAKALMRVINLIDEESAQGATVLVDYLASLIGKAAKEAVDPGQTHYVFESLCVLVKRAYRVVGEGLTQHILPIMMEILQNDLLDLIPYALQVIALMVDQRKAITGNVGQYVDFVPVILKPEVWQRKANIPAALLVVESFLAGCPEVVLTGEHFNRVMGLFQGMFKQNKTLPYSFRLAAGILPHCGCFENLNDAALLVPMLKLIQTNKTELLVKYFVLFLCRYIIKKDAMALASVFEAIQPGMYVMVLEKIVLTALSDLGKRCTFSERQVIVMGMSQLIAHTAQLMGPLFPSAVQLTCDIAAHSGANTQFVVADADTDFNEVVADTSDPFSRLCNAQHVDDLFNIEEDVKKVLALAVLQHLPTTQGGEALVGSLSLELRNRLNSFVQP
ncbi:hypothetical protein L596_002239 [Steinernema carpocapsae]|uniref:Exportin-2 n=1 Tax=Steinernema carpocapsae TaxID=34508 RepID=A0A4U8UNX7_STECR|nr:hypothetical protein L596_002239 [Steinernema carpocapsae]